MESNWVYSSQFDYIHGRYLAGAIKDWPNLMRQAYEYVMFLILSFQISFLTPQRYTKPGGYVEFQDFDMKFYTITGEWKPGCAAERWAEECVAGIKTIGREPEPGPKLERFIKEAGFVNVTEKVLAVPVGTWPKDRKLVGEKLHRVCNFIYNELMIVSLVLCRKRSEHLISYNFSTDWKGYL
jgi:hypothetical protein